MKHESKILAVLFFVGKVIMWATVGLFCMVAYALGALLSATKD
jgi:fatty-acid desaturase